MDIIIAVLRKGCGLGVARTTEVRAMRARVAVPKWRWAGENENPFKIGSKLRNLELERNIVLPFSSWPHVGAAVVAQQAAHDRHGR
jgi:hypothetical protein